MSTKDNLINVGLLAAGGAAIAAASGVYGKGSRSRALSFGEIQNGDRVTIASRFGTQKTGTAVMRNSYGDWVLNMGGKYGTPGLASEENFVKATRFRGRGSMTRDGSYEATLMFDADEDDPTRIAQQRLMASPFAQQARPLTAEPPRITSAQGSAARGVTEGYVEAYLDGENIAISTFLSRRLRGKAKSYSGQYARRMKAALDAMVASGQVYRDTTPNGAASYRRTSTAGSAARGSSSVLRGMTAKPGTPIPGPSLKTLDERLNLGGEEGRSLKYFMQSGQLQAALDYADELLGGNGVEYIESQQDTMRRREGLSYVNMGDTYDTTLIYDHKTGRFYVGAWGDWVERYPKRFG